MERIHKIKNQGIAYLLLAVFLFSFFFIGFFQVDQYFPNHIKSVHVIFLSIVLEAIPFILLGVFISSFIQIFISEQWIQKYLPKNPFTALIPAAVLGAIFPVCECAIVPIVRRLIKKGVPLHIGVVFLVGAPILNPVVFASTYYAFQSNTEVAFARMGLAFVLSIVIGFIIYLFFENRHQLKEEKHQHHHHHKNQNKFMSMLHHASDEFFDMGKYLIIGAFVASLFQAYLDRSLLINIGNDEWLGPAVMMAFAYVLSLCSEADAFVASSFGNLFSTSSLLAFLVYGPMIDFKNTIMLFAFFKRKFVFTFLIVVTIVVYFSILIYQGI